MNTQITPDLVHKTAHKPGELAMWQDDVSGTQAVLNGCRELVEGKIKLLKVCAANHPSNGGEILETITVGMDDKPRENERACFRYVGENGDPSGAGSSSVVASWYPYCHDAASAACVIVAQLARHGGACLFRLKP